MEDVSLAKRILKDLKCIFEKDSNLIEFDVILVEDKLYNKSPVIHQDHRLALESWSVKHVYNYIYRQFLDSRSNGKRTDNNLLQEWTRVLLLINPDLTTAWNCRRQLVVDNFVPIIDELKFSKLLMTRKPKSAENFAYRQWLFRIMKETHTPIDQNLINNELDVCLEASNRYRCNYYSWNHRRWIIQNLFNDSLRVYLCELNIIKHWIERHISDYSGFSYRQFILDKLSSYILKQESNNLNLGDNSFQSLLVSEISMINNLFKLYPDQESLFLHRRYILRRIGLILDQHKEEEELFKLKENEKQFIANHLNTNQWSSQLVNRHCLWLANVLKWNL